MVEHVHCIVKCVKKKKVITDSHPQDGQESSCTKNPTRGGVRRVCTYNISTADRQTILGPRGAEERNEKESKNGNDWTNVDVILGNISGEGVDFLGKKKSKLREVKHLGRDGAVKRRGR